MPGGSYNSYGGRKGQSQRAFSGNGGGRAGRRNKSRGGPSRAQGHMFKGKWYPASAACKSPGRRGGGQMRSSAPGYSARAEFDDFDYRPDRSGRQRVGWRL